MEGIRLPCPRRVHQFFGSESSPAPCFAFFVGKSTAVSRLKPEADPGADAAPRTGAAGHFVTVLARFVPRCVISLYKKPAHPIELFA